MKQNKKLLTGIGLICSNYFIAQQASTTNSPGAATNGLTSNQFWSRAGNTNINGTNNIFGTLWNSPIYTQTMGLNRMKLNGNVAYNVNGFAGARNGFLLLGLTKI